MTFPFRFGYRLNRVMDFVNEIANGAIRPFGLKIPGARVLLWLVHEGDSRVGDLAAGVSIEPSSLSHILARLTARGFIRRRREAADNRTIIVSLTPAGRGVAKVLTPHFKKLDALMAAAFAEQERVVLERMLDRMYEAVVRGGRLRTHRKARAANVRRRRNADA
jgi:MarR family transcriptional regulator, organic hydroperoxide resistance regulator